MQMLTKSDFAKQSIFTAYAQWAQKEKHSQFSIAYTEQDILNFDPCKENTNQNSVLISYIYDGTEIDISIVPSENQKCDVIINVHAEVRQPQDNPHKICTLVHTVNTPHHPINNALEFIEDVSTEACALVDKGFVEDLIVVSEANHEFYKNACGTHKQNNWTQRIPTKPGLYWFSVQSPDPNYCAKPSIALVFKDDDTGLKFKSFYNNPDDYCYVDKFCRIEEERGNRPYWCEVWDCPHLYIDENSKQPISPSVIGENPDCWQITPLD